MFLHIYHFDTKTVKFLLLLGNDIAEYNEIDCEL